jgi:hypothetical protein
MGFFVGCMTGERKGQWARRGLLLVARLEYLWLDEFIPPLLKTNSPEIIRVVFYNVGSVLVKLIQF